MTKTPNTTYGLFTHDGLDGICYGLREAKREAKDLKSMMDETPAIVKVSGKGDHDAVYDVLNEMVRGTLRRSVVTKAMIAKVQAKGLTIELGAH